MPLLDKQPNMAVIDTVRLRSEVKSHATAATQNPRQRLKVCYSDAYMRQTQAQQHFETSEVASDLHELMIPQRARPIWPSIALEPC